MFGCLPLRFYNITKDKRYLDLGLPYADTQWELPANANEEERKWDKRDILGKLVFGLMICI